MHRFFYTLLIASLMMSCVINPSNENVDLFIRTKVLNTSFDAFEDKAVVIHNGIIHEVRDSDFIKASKHSITQGYAYPGFIDAHCHFEGYAKGLTEANLYGTRSFEEILERLKVFKEQNLDLDFIVGRGWDQNDWEVKEFPDNSILNKEFPNVPVVLTRIDGHAVLANKAALDCFKITHKTQVDGGVLQLANGKPTGILIDNAVGLVKRELDWERLKSNLLTAQQNCFTVGLTTLDDAGLDLESILFLDSLQKIGDLKMKLYVMASDNPENFNYFMENGPIKTERLNVRSFKFYADGALGSRGACLLHGYADDHWNHGLMLSGESHFRESAEALYRNGFQMNTHAIGDSANRVLLNIYKEVLIGENDKRWRIEHAQVVSDQDLNVYKTHSVLPSVQPTHATSDMYWAEERLGSEVISNAYAYKELLHQSGVLPLGTDFPVEDIDPLKTFYAAVVRKDANGYPEGGFQMENAISRSEALKGMTMWAAFANFEENEKGTIEKGKAADFTVLDTDLLNCSPDEILKAKVLYTVVNGEIVYAHDIP